MLAVKLNAPPVIGTRWGHVDCEIKDRYCSNEMRDISWKHLGIVDRESKFLIVSVNHVCAL